MLSRILELRHAAVDVEMTLAKAPGDARRTMFWVRALHADGSIVAELSGGFLALDPTDMDVRQFDIWNEDALFARSIVGDLKSRGEFQRFVLIERIDVEKKARGNGLALRLMREVRDTLFHPGALALCQAAPDGGTEADVAKLSRYYASDPDLAFKAAPTDEAGWLYAAWPAPCSSQADQNTLALKVWSNHLSGDHRMPTLAT